MEAALFTIIWSKSAAKTNRSGDNGSPCTPRLQWNFLPGTPLRMTDEFPVDNIVLIHEIHLLGKPIRLRICVMATCSTVSNAFSKSSLRMIASLLLCLHWCMYSKLHVRQSCIERVLINPYWLRWMRRMITCWRRSANNFVISFRMQLRRDICL